MPGGVGTRIKGLLVTGSRRVHTPSMAAFDGLRQKTDPIAQKLIGGEEQLRQGSVKRMELREILGSKTMREITLK